MDNLKRRYKGRKKNQLIQNERKKQWSYVISAYL